MFPPHALVLALVAKGTAVHLVSLAAPSLARAQRTLGGKGNVYAVTLMSLASFAPCAQPAQLLWSAKSQTSLELAGAHADHPWPL